MNDHDITGTHPSPYLDSYVALMVGGMAFKVDDRVHIVGNTPTGATYERKGTILAFHQEAKILSFLDEDANIIHFDFRRIQCIEHLKEERHG